MAIREGIYSFRKAVKSQKMYLDLNIAGTGEWSLPSNNYGLKTTCKDMMLLKEPFVEQLSNCTLYFRIRAER